MLRGTRLTQEWRKLHPEELHELYPSTIIIRGFKSRRIIWAAYVARIVTGEVHTGF